MCVDWSDLDDHGHRITLHISPPSRDIHIPGNLPWSSTTRLCIRLELNSLGRIKTSQTNPCEIAIWDSLGGTNCDYKRHRKESTISSLKAPMPRESSSPLSAQFFLVHCMCEIGLKLLTILRGRVLPLVVEVLVALPLLRGSPWPPLTDEVRVGSRVVTARTRPFSPALLLFTLLDLKFTNSCWCCCGELRNCDCEDAGTRLCNVELWTHSSLAAANAIPNSARPRSSNSSISNSTIKKNRSEQTHHRQHQNYCYWLMNMSIPQRKQTLQPSIQHQISRHFDQRGRESVTVLPLHWFSGKTPDALPMLLKYVASHHAADRCLGERGDIS